jgi:hypothetical protein
MGLLSEMIAAIAKPNPASKINVNADEMTCRKQTARMRFWGLALVRVFTTASQAATQASATVAKLTFQLIDLELADASMPSLSWTSSATTYQVSRDFGQITNLFLQTAGDPLWNWSFQQTTTDFYSSTDLPPVDLTSQQPGVAAVGDGGRLSADALVTTPTTPATLTAFAYSAGAFWLSAHSELRVTAELNTAISGPGSAGFLTPAWAAGDIGVLHSQASAYAEVYLGAASTVQRSEGSSFTASSRPFEFPVAAFGDAGLKAVSMSLRNGSDPAAGGDFYALAQVQATEFALMVAEPAAPALLLAGLTLTGLVALRRRRT